MGNNVIVYHSIAEREWDQLLYQHPFIVLGVLVVVIVILLKWVNGGPRY